MGQAHTYGIMVILVSYDVASLYTRVPRQQALKVTQHRLDGQTHRGRLNNSYPPKVYRQYKTLDPKNILTTQTNVNSVNSSVKNKKNDQKSQLSALFDEYHGQIHLGNLI